MARFDAETLQDKKTRVVNNLKIATDLNDISSGSDLDVLGDTISREDYKNQNEAGDILLLDNLDNLRGTELEEEAAKHELSRELAKKATYNGLEITDPAITKIETTVRIGGANAGDIFLPGTDTSSLPATGILLIGERGEAEYEQKEYFSKSATGFNLNPLTPLTNDHGSGEPIVLKTVGDRVFAAGHKVKVPSSPGQEEVVFSIISDWTIYDGEEKSTGVSIECDVAGTAGNVTAGTISEFQGAEPFAGAIPYNPASIENGEEEQSDESLRDAIREEEGKKARGTREAVDSIIKEAEYGAQKVVYTQFFESASNCEPSIVYIDDGAGFTPPEITQAEEIIIASAIGGEQYFQLKNFPLVDTASLNLYKNGSTPLVLGVDYLINKYNGSGSLTTPLVAGESIQAGNSGLTVNAYDYYSGLLAVAQWKVDGLPKDFYEKYPDALPFRLGYAVTDFPGAKFGNLIEVRVPVQAGIQVEGELTMEPGVNKEDAIALTIQNVLTYVNTLTIGATVVYDQLKNCGLKVKRVQKFTVTVPSADVPTGIGLLPRIVIGNIQIN